MRISDPFLYRSLRPGRQLYRQLLVALTGPLLLELPRQLSYLMRGHLETEADRLGLLAFVTFLCIRSIAGSVGAIAQERERGSWEVLLCSGYRPREIIFGIWRACLLPRLFEVCLILPWLFWRDEHPLAQFSLMLGLAGFYTSLGLFASLRCTSGLKAMQLAYGWLGLSGVGSFMLWVAEQVGSGSKADWVTQLLMLNPWAATLNLESHFTLGGAAVHWGLCLLLMLTMSRQATATPSMQAARRGRRARNENPLRYRNQFHAPAAQWALSALYCLLVLLPWWGWRGQGNEESQRVLVMVGHLGFWLVRATYSCCHCLCREREQGSLDALLTTRLRPDEILSGLLWQTLIPLSRQALLLSPLLGLCVSGQPGRWLLIQILTQVTLWGWGMAAIAASLFYRSTLKAFQATYFWLAFVTVGTLTLDVSLIDPLLHINRPLLCLVNPVLAAIYLGLPQPDHSSDPWGPWCLLACLAFHLALIWASRGFTLKKLRVVQQ